MSKYGIAFAVGLVVGVTVPIAGFLLVDRIYAANAEEARKRWEQRRKSS